MIVLKVPQKSISFVSSAKALKTPMAHSTECRTRIFSEWKRLPGHLARRRGTQLSVCRVSAMRGKQSEFWPHPTLSMCLRRYLVIGSSAHGEGHVARLSVGGGRRMKALGRSKQRPYRPRGDCENPGLSQIDPESGAGERN